MEAEELKMIKTNSKNKIKDLIQAIVTLIPCTMLYSEKAQNLLLVYL